MSYCALYKVNTEKAISQGVCFNRFYTNTKAYQDIYIYALDNYNMFKTTSELSFSPKEIKEYLNSFLEMGFKFDYSYLKKIETEIADTGGWEIHMSSKENSALSMMIITNVFRYLYEKQYREIVMFYLKLKNDDRKDVSNWNKFIISHYSKDYWVTHSIEHSTHNVHKMLSEEEFQQKIINRPGNCGSTSYLPKQNVSIHVKSKDLKNDFQNNISNVYSYFGYPKIEKTTVIPKVINKKNESISSRVSSIPRVFKLVAKPRIGANSRRG